MLRVSCTNLTGFQGLPNAGVLRRCPTLRSTFMQTPRQDTFILKWPTSLLCQLDKCAMLGSIISGYTYCMHPGRQLADGQ
jgi:hypothetical protein